VIDSGDLPTPGPDELASRLRTAITRLAFHLRGPATRDGVTPTRLAALSILAASGPLRVGDLAHDLGLSAAGMSGLSQTLTEAGWVERRPDPDDHRVGLLRLTEAGTSTLARFRTQGAGELAQHVAALDADQQAELLGAVPVLEALAERHANAHHPYADRRPQVAR